MMSTWLLALSILLVTLMGRVDLAVALLSDLVWVLGGSYQPAVIIRVGSFAGTLVGTVGLRRRRHFAAHDILLIWLSVGGMVLILLCLHGFAIETALA